MFGNPRELLVIFNDLEGMKELSSESLLTVQKMIAAVTKREVTTKEEQAQVNQIKRNVRFRNFMNQMKAAANRMQEI